MKKILHLLCMALLFTTVSVAFVACKNGDDGSDGKDGSSIIWKGSLDAAPEKPEYLWAYYNIKNGCSYVWNGSEWTLLSGTPEKTFDVQVLELTKKDVPLRTVLSDGTVSSGETLELGFKTGNDDIPYIKLTAELLKNCFDMEFSISSVDADSTEVIIVNRTRNTAAVLDLSKRMLAYENYDLFYQLASKVFYDPAAAEVIEQMTGKGYMKLIDCSSINGQSVAVGWSSQDIGVCIWKDGNSYAAAIPLQTLNDLILASEGNFFVYNGKYLYKTNSISGALLEDYHNESTKKNKKRSKELAEFCYNELCLNLDANYGLKAIHGINDYPDFDTYFKSAGIDVRLKSEDAMIFARTLKDVCEFYFGDGHSNYMGTSHYLAETNFWNIKGYTTSAQMQKSIANNKKYLGARKNKLGADAVPGLTFIDEDKTAIVRFDEFTINVGRLSLENRIEDGNKLISEGILEKNYAGNSAIENTYDTVAFIYAVNKEIQKKGSVENIILDLSNNGGGSVPTAEFVIAWLLGECKADFTNPNTGAKWSVSYIADVNMNGTMGEDSDTVKDKNLFCIVSPCSFSCGNMVPAMLKASDSVTILGVTSGGGSSIVQNSSAADGSIFRMSSKFVMSTNKNGSNYDIDKGVEPHYYINKPENFYDVEKLAKLVTSINEAKLGN